MKKHNILLIILSSIFMPNMFQAVYAGGFRVEGNGVEEIGSAGAITARSKGAMSLFTNPANLGNLKKAKGEAVLGSSIFFQKGYYSNIGQSTWSSEAQTDFEPYGAFLFKFKDRFAFAIGQSNTYHHTFEWTDPEFIARYVSSGQEMIVTELTAGASVKFGSKWSFGITLRNATADFYFEQKRPKPIFGQETFPDRFYDYAHQNQADDSGIGFGLGMYYTPRFGMEFALSYFSAVDFSFSGVHRVVQTTDLENSNFVADFASFAYENDMHSAWSIPQRITLASSFKTTVRTRVELDLAYEGWGTNDFMAIQTHDENGEPITFDLGTSWNNVMDYSAGGEFRHTPQLIWRAGIAYRSHILDKGDLHPGFPTYDRFTASFGISYKFDKNTIEFGYAYNQYRDVKVSGQELVIDINSEDYLISNAQSGLFESQKHQMSLAYRRRF